MSLLKQNLDKYYPLKKVSQQKIYWKKLEWRAGFTILNPHFYISDTETNKNIQSISLAEIKKISSDYSQVLQISTDLCEDEVIFKAKLLFHDSASVNIFERVTERNIFFCNKTYLITAFCSKFCERKTISISKDLDIYLVECLLYDLTPYIYVSD